MFSLFISMCLATCLKGKRFDPSWKIEPTTELFGQTWELEMYQGFVYADAVGRSSIVIRDRGSGRVFFPGPSLVVPQGSTLDVTFYNYLGKSSSLHWHGLEQRLSPWMDGIGHVSQEPIQSGHFFRYIIPLSSQTGTYFWHSHTSEQIADGLFGGLVIVPATQRYRVAKDTVLLLDDYYHRESSSIAGELVGNVWTASGYFPDWESGLINGRGSSSCMDSLYQNNLHSLKGYASANQSLLCDERYNTNYELVVEPHKTYRLRLINAGSGYTLRFSVDNHMLMVIAVDGHDVEPDLFDEIYVYLAQRYDVLLVTDQVPANYTIRARTLHEDDHPFFQVTGTLRYHSTNTDSRVVRKFMEPQNVLAFESSLCRAPHEPSPPNFGEPIYVTINCSSDKWRCSINNISFEPSVTPSLLLKFQHKDISEGNPSTQVIHLELGKTYDLIINNVANMSHPMHLHHFSFWLMGKGRAQDGWFEYNVTRLWSKDKVILRDTVQIEANSWSVWRFTADQSVVALLHCHLSWHAASGMMLLFNVGPDHLVSPPPGHWQTWIDVSSLSRCATSEGSLIFIPTFSFLSVVLFLSFM